MKVKPHGFEYNYEYDNYLCERLLSTIMKLKIKLEEPIYSCHMLQFYWTRIQR